SRSANGQSLLVRLDSLNVEASSWIVELVTDSCGTIGDDSAFNSVVSDSAREYEDGFFMSWPSMKKSRGLCAFS
ncbi:hypothetical protein WICPIJ_002745, partial [Wickerhamomyces pijperi]